MLPLTRTLLPLLALLAAAPAAADPSLAEVIGRVQPKIVKIYGAGGLEGMENYQSGLLISPEGHILTVWSHVLLSDVVTVVAHDGRRFEAKLLGADPRLEAAVLKVEGQNLPAFDLAPAATPQAGDLVLAMSNLFGIAIGNEPASVQRGTIAACTELAARRGTYETPYHGPIYVLDVVTNNPGAPGGALVSREGQLLGMLGKELRNRLNNTWLNYAVPLAELKKSVEEIRAGKFVARQEEAAKKPAHALDLERLGLVLVPDVVPRTPPYVDRVLPGSPAEKAGLRPDDLVLLFGDRLIPTCKALRSELSMIDFEDRVHVTVQRGSELLEVTLP